MNTIISTTYKSPVGLLTLACDGDALVGLWIEGQKYYGGDTPGAMVSNSAAPGAMTSNSDTPGTMASNSVAPEAKSPNRGAPDLNAAPVLNAAKKWLDRYFKGEKPDISELPLAPAGGEFRQMVWGILCGIPYGEVVAYGEIAKKMAAKMGRKSMSSQAVGGAVGHNPISIIIPCHRVVGSNGSLTGYAGGIDTKVKLLELEGADMSSLFVPTKGTAL